MIPLDGAFAPPQNSVPEDSGDIFGPGNRESQTVEQWFPAQRPPPPPTGPDGPASPPEKQGVHEPRNKPSSRPWPDVLLLNSICYLHLNHLSKGPSPITAALGGYSFNMRIEGDTVQSTAL